MASKPSIVIVGGGPAGLTAGNMLWRHGFDVTVFESDSSLASRDQGGTLDLHPHEGQLALQKAGLLQDFLALARHDDQEQRVVDAVTGAILREEIPDPGTGTRPEIDRVVLRKMLLDPLPRATVVWGARVVEVVEAANRRWAVRLQGGAVHECDLIIGADGAGSAVRTALTGVRPLYTGVTFVELRITEVDRKHPAIARLVGRGTLLALHNEKGIFAQRNGNAVVRVYAALKTTNDTAERPERALAGMSRHDLLARYEGWAPALLSLIEDADQIAAIRPIVSLPAGTRWPVKSGLTLIGDAAHVMPPMGTGVNLAMLDAAELAEAIVSTTNWREAVCAQEQIMLNRATTIAEDCLRAFGEWFAA
ncbi:FAD-dependent oxidoreductase [Paraburkholderia acidipaludis]|uniref:FAD-dependent oxidoreductase n=1 Tax=Paraburkholderia acidipaludis TaxID=660537 RepID=UPI0005BB8F62|nr:NAD(P)/FAD-dependent oxidoreductase [Paraburkholderia acidipaludis]